MFIQEILDALLKTERVKEVKKERKTVYKEEPTVHNDVKVVKTEPTPLTAKQLQEQEEAREIMEVSMLDDDLLLDDEEVAISNNKTIENKEPKVTEVKSAVPDSNKTQSNGTKIKAISTKSANIDATIFDELKDIDFNAEMFDEDLGNIDFNTVSFFCAFNLKSR